MKKIFLILLFVIPLIAQNTDKTTDTSKREVSYFFDLFMKTLESMRVTLIDTSGSVINKLPVTVEGITLNADSLTINPYSSGGVYQKAVTTTASQLGTYSSGEVWLYNESEVPIQYAYSSGSTYWVLLEPKTIHIKRIDNSNRIWVKSTSATNLKYEILK